jgi:hypothetical protein
VEPEAVQFKKEEKRKRKGLCLVSGRVYFLYPVKGEHVKD